MALKELAQKEVVTAEQHDDLTTVVRKMRDEEVGSVVIVSEDEPVSIVSDRKIAMAAADGDIQDRTVEEVMTEDLVTAHIDTNVDELIEKMSDEGIRRVPIVDDEGSLAGLVSMDDLLVELSEEFDTLTQIPKKQSGKLGQT
jgi:CBS domain-containing protein